MLCMGAGGTVGGPMACKGFGYFWFSDVVFPSGEDFADIQKNIF